MREEMKEDWKSGTSTSMTHEAFPLFHDVNERVGVTTSEEFTKLETSKT